ncbi:MAG: DUF3857 domain-containing protein [Bacteroidia bacterium]
MIRIFLLILLLTGLPVCVFSQFLPPPVVWGNVPKDQREMTAYRYDSTAAAVILCDWGTWYPVDMPAGIVKLHRHVRLKILSEAGIPYSEIRIIYDKSRGESVTDLKAQTINFTGNHRKTIPLKLRILPEKVLGNGMAEKSFVFREVKSGSIIEYSYVLKTTAVDHLKTWYFQSEIPTVYSEVKLVGFDPYTYKGIPQQLDLEPVEESRWIMKHTPAFHNVPFLNRPDDYRIALRFQLQNLMGEPEESEQWRLITLDLQQASLLTDDSVSQRALYALTQSLIRNTLTDEEKIDAIHAHVRNHVQWNGISDIWLNQSPSALYRSRKGNSAEINMLMAHMLWSAGITAYRCFVSTRNHGKPVMYPLRDQFNDLFILALADGQSFILDATEKYLPYDLPPRRMLNEVAWIIKEDVAQWTRMPDQFRAETSTVGQLSMDSSGHVTGIFEKIYKGYAAQDYLSSQEIKNRTGSGVVPGQSISVPVPFLADSFFQTTDQMTVFNPLFTFRKLQNPFWEKKRLYPLEFPSLSRETYILNFTIPPNFQVIRMPASTRLVLEGKEMMFEYLCEVRNSTIQVRATFEISKSKIYPEDYPAVKDLYDKMIARMQEDIVLIRKE